MFGDNHLESRRRVTGLSAWDLAAGRFGVPAQMPGSGVTSSRVALSKLMTFSKMQFPQLQIGAQWYVPKSLLESIKCHIFRALSTVTNTAIAECPVDTISNLSGSGLMAPTGSEDA